MMLDGKSPLPGIYRELLYDAAALVNEGVEISKRHGGVKTYMVTITAYFWQRGYDVDEFRKRIQALKMQGPL